MCPKIILMSRLTPIMIFLVVVVIATDACSRCHHGCINIDRRKRASPDQLQNALAEFDLRRKEELPNEIQEMSSEEKQEFINDLGKMNEARDLEIASVDKTAGGTDQFLQQLSDKVAQDFSGKMWFKRMRSIEGEKISRLINGKAK